jgi:hypothetical protein
MPWKDTAGRTIRSTCQGGVRHWFTLYGRVGVRSPWCMRCAAPNPRKLTPSELEEFEAHTSPEYRARLAEGRPYG